MATMKRVFVNGVTPKGKAMYAFLRKVETYEGKELGYSIQIVLSPEETKAFKQHLIDEFEKAKESYDLKPGKRWSAEPSLGMHEREDGTVTFKFKCKHMYTDREGAIVKRTVPVVDAKGHPIKADTLGNGSIIRISYSLAPYWMSNNQNGLSLYLRGVQVLKYIPFGGDDAASLGFAVEDGYDSTVEGEYDNKPKAEAVEEDDNPFIEGEDF